MSDKTITAEALGIVHKKGRVAVATGASLKAPKISHEVRGRVVVASSSMPEAEGDKRVFRAKKTPNIPH